MIPQEHGRWMTRAPGAWGEAFTLQAMVDGYLSVYDWACGR
jgi:hypothetical protein